MRELLKDEWGFTWKTRPMAIYRTLVRARALLSFSVSQDARLTTMTWNRGPEDDFGPRDFPTYFSDGTLDLVEGPNKKSQPLPLGLGQRG